MKIKEWDVPHLGNKSPIPLTKLNKSTQKSFITAMGDNRVSWKTRVDYIVAFLRKSQICDLLPEWDVPHSGNKSLDRETNDRNGMSPIPEKNL